MADLPPAVSLPLTAVEPPSDGGRVPLLMAHGLFGQARNFASPARRLAESTGRRVLTVDLRNHGAAPHDARMDYPAMAADLAATIRTVGAPLVLFGHSMGGKAAMALALSHPELLAALIVADIAPVGYQHHEHASIVEAMQALDLGTITRRSDADRALAAALPDPGVRGFIVQNLEIAGGRARWRPNLTALAESMTAILGFPDDLPETAYEGPTLFLHGSRSSYVPASAHGRIRALFPDVEIQAIDAGHWLHAENPTAFAEALEAWLATLGA
ncbi:MAG: alpha/beta fold hydrolase [Pseudomonadota bacterium]